MALDATKGFIFYTVYGESKPSLRRALLDGQNETILVSNKIEFPHDLTLDIPNERIYWIDKHRNYIQSINYDGKMRMSLIKGIPRNILQLPISSLTNFEDQLYFVIDSEYIYEMNKKEHIPRKLLQKNSEIISLNIFHKQKQPVSKYSFIIIIIVSYFYL